MKFIVLVKWQFGDWQLAKNTDTESEAREVVRICKQCGAKDIKMFETTEIDIEDKQPKPIGELPVRIDFKVTTDMRMETSHGSYGHQKAVELDVTIGFKDDTYGWFEICDVETGGDNWYAEGGIWMYNGVVTDYDGVFELPDFIVNKLNELGIDTSEL